MRKYIIEVGDAYVLHALGRKLIMPVIINNDTEYWVNTNIQLTPYTEPDTEKVREEAYRQGYDTGYGTKVNEFYEQGLADAWEAARKIVTMPNREFINSDILDLDPGESIFTKYTASEAIERIRQYEQEQKQEEEQIQVGDEVRNIENGWIAVVCNIDGECMTLMDTNGALGDGYDVNRFTKTGRHFPEIAEVLRKMKEES